MGDLIPMKNKFKGKKIPEYARTEVVKLDDNKYDLFMNEIKEDIRERERRSDQRQRDLENRLEKNLEYYRSEAIEREKRYQKTADEIKEDLATMKRDNKSNLIALWTLAVSSLLGIAAMVITVILTR